MKTSICLGLTLVCLAVQGKVLNRDFRAIGSLTVSDYYKKFTSDSKELLKGLGLYSVRMVKDNSIRPTSETIKWTQASRCFFSSCKEEYRLVDYYKDGDTSSRVYKVFVNKDTSPPDEFRTSGYGGKLHFGFLTFGSDDGAVFFVIHPNSWRPFQHRFKTNTFTKFFKDGISKAASAAGSAAAGAAIGSIVPGLGTAIGGIVGFAVGSVGSSLTDDYFGDYLRYIG